MISAPMPVPQLLAKASSAPLLPPVSPCIFWYVRVPRNRSKSLVPACPNGCSRDCPSPVPKPSSETAKLCTRTRDIKSSLEVVRVFLVGRSHEQQMGIGSHPHPPPRVN